MRRITVMGIAIVVLAAAPTARAQQDADETSQADKDRARAHYDAGLRAYNVGDFDVAIDEWRTAYRLHGSAGFLFNIGQAYRSKRDYAQAIFFFNAYLRERPDAPNREEVTTLRDEMQRLLDEERASRDRPPTQPIEPAGDDAAKDGDALDVPADTGDAATAPTEPPQPTEPMDTALPAPVSGAPGDDARPAGGGLRRAGLITGAAGAGLIVTGIAFGISASSTESDLEKAAQRGDPWTPALEDEQDSGERAALLSTGFWIAGTAAVATGGALYYLGWREARSGGDDGAVVQVAPMIGPTTGIAVRVEY